jgi:hypothetical protein
MTLYKPEQVCEGYIAYSRLYTAILPVNNLYNEFIIQQALFLEKKVRCFNESTTATYIKLYNRHYYPMKSDITNVQYYKHL